MFQRVDRPTAVIMSLLLVTLLGASDGRAEELFQGDYEERLARLEAELFALSSRSNTVPERACRKPACSSNCRRPGYYAGAGFIVAKPHFKESFQYSQINLGTGQQTLVPFSYDYEFTPYTQLGFRTASGLGLMVDYWQFDHRGNRRTAVSDGLNVLTANATTVIFPATIVADDPGEVLTADSSLETQIVNLLATIETTIHAIELRIGFGLRYALLDQQLSNSVVNAVAIPQGVLNWGRRYEGVGPAAKIDARRRLACSAFSAIGGIGAGLLFGHKDLDRFVLGDVGVPPAAPFLNLEDADEVVGMVELKMGMEWAHTFCNGTQLALQGRYEGQLWAEAGAPTLGFLGFQGFGCLVELRR